jgi:hypothetical protein
VQQQPEALVQQQQQQPAQDRHPAVSSGINSQDDAQQQDVDQAAELHLQPQSLALLKDQQRQLLAALRAAELQLQRATARGGRELDRARRGARSAVTKAAELVVSNGGWREAARSAACDDWDIGVYGSGAYGRLGFGVFQVRCPWQV